MECVYTINVIYRKIKSRVCNLQVDLLPKGLCDIMDAEWHGYLFVVIARMLNAGCTDAGYKLTFCLMPTVYISYKTLTIIWATQSKLLMCILTKRKL